MRVPPGCDQKWLDSDAHAAGRMKRSRFNEEQMIGILKEQDEGMARVEAGVFT